MATSDLCEVLKRHQAEMSGASMDTSQERQICTAVLRLLHDKSHDVQAIAVKTLGVLLTTVQQEQVLEIADSLADQVLDASKSQLRDVYAIGLRTLVKTIPARMGDAVSQRLVGRLLNGIRTSSSSNNNNTNNDDDAEEILLACLDCLTDILTRFGATALAVARQHEPILQMCLDQLTQPSAVVRKRAGTVLGCLSVVLTDHLLQRMVEALLELVSSTSSKGADQHDTRALIRTMCTVAGAVGHRLQQAQMDRILPIFLQFTQPANAVTGDDDDHGEDDDDHDEHEERHHQDDYLANELRESCFMGLESFVVRCPNQVEPHLQSIITAALAYMSYDPNYSYGNDDAMAVDDDNDEPEYDDEEDDDEYEEEEDDEEEDDDDESWKVRRSAIRALKAIVQSRTHDPSSLWITEYPIRQQHQSTVALAIMGRFKEREENCRIEIMDCFTQLLSAMVAAGKNGTMRFAAAASNSMDTGAPPCIDFEGSYAPKLVKSCEQILSIKKGNERSKSSALALLSTMCTAPGGIGSEQAIASVLKHMQIFLSSDPDAAHHRGAEGKALRLDALTLVHAILASDQHDPRLLRTSVRETLLPQLCQSVQEQWYKVIAEALRALAEVPRAFVHGYPDDFDDAARQTECGEVATLLFEAVEPLLAAHDVDQEIKECALKACAALLSSLFSSLNDAQTGRLLQLLLERLNNETTRIAAMKTLSAVASSPTVRLGADTVAPAITVMASFLKQQSRSLKQTALEALDVVITHHGTVVAANTELYSSVLLELAPLVVANDLHLAHLSL